MWRLVSLLVKQLRRLERSMPSSGRAVAARVAGAGAVLCGLGIWTNVWVDATALPHIHGELERVPRAQVAIVPGCRVYTDGTPTATLEDRLAAALELYRAGKVEKILVSGDHAAPEYDEVNAMWRWLQTRGVPEEDVFLDHAGLRTFDTMARAAGIFGVADAVVCTQRFHLPRSVFLARRHGMEASGYVADRRRYAAHRKNAAREFFAKTVAFMDSYVFDTRPRFEGEAISIAGDGRATHDRWSR